MLEEVVVTARKKSAAESAQDVPVSVTVLSGNTIEAAFAKDLTDVGLLMPNVRLDDAGVFPGTSNYSIRGMGFVSSIASTEPTVGVFVDGIYLGANLGGAPDTFDLESVEVLRGPQGTLFGRNVTGGAVVMRSRRPTGDFGGLTRLGVGSGGRRLAAAAIEGTVTPTLAGKIFTQFSDQDGDFTNLAAGDDFGAERNTFVRPTLRWRPNGDLDIRLIGEHGKTTGDGAAARVLNDPATLATRTDIVGPSATDDLAVDIEGRTEIEWKQLVLDANWSIGDGTLTSATGYRDVSYFSQGEEGSAAPLVNSFNWMEQDQFSEELRYAGKAAGDKLDYTVGLYYFEQDLQQRYRLDLFGVTRFLPHGMLDHRTASIFAQGDYQFIDRWFLTLGLRYTWEEKSAVIARGNNCDSNFNCVFPFRDEESWDNTSPKIGLNWQINDDVLAYVSWTKGFRSGGYNTRTNGATESPGPYDAETVKAYEAGVKTEFLQRRARLNIAAFHNEYSDLQRSVLNPLTLSNSIANAAEATIDGAELEFSVLPVTGLTLTGSVGYLDARYDNFDLLDVDLNGTPDPGRARGLQLIRAPEWTSAASATYDLDAGDVGLFTARVAYSYTSKAPIDDANSRFLDSYGLLDASLGWNSLGERLTISAWGKNLTNELYATTGSRSALFTNIYQGLPRIYGLELVYRF